MLMISLRGIIGHKWASFLSQMLHLELIYIRGSCLMQSDWAYGKGRVAHWNRFLVTVELLQRHKCARTGLCSLGPLLHQRKNKNEDTSLIFNIKKCTDDRTWPTVLHRVLIIVEATVSSSVSFWNFSILTLNLCLTTILFGLISSQKLWSESWIEFGMPQANGFNLGRELRSSWHTQKCSGWDATAAAGATDAAHGGNVRCQHIGSLKQLKED